MRSSTSTPVILCRVTWGAACMRSLLHDPGELFGLIFLLQRLDDRLEIAVHHVQQLVKRQVDAVIGDPALREIVGPDALGAVARAHLQLARLRLGLIASLLLGSLEARLEERQGTRAVLV